MLNQNRSELRSLSAACTGIVRNSRDLSVLFGSARLCPHSFSPPGLIALFFNLHMHEELVVQVRGAARPIYSRPYLALASPAKDIRSGPVVSPHQTQSLHIDV
ncbi:hypothetical protein J6590_022838 [Homalodisca vitripennis]|nr:hypothetical protein J6590_022838 [Homalodisca vitripennis]